MACTVPCRARTLRRGANDLPVGNVGLRAETTGWVDHVTTPAGAFALMVGEDALDRFFVRWVESHTPNRFFRAALG